MPFKSKDEKRSYDAEYYRRTQGSGGGGYSVLSEDARSFKVRHPSGKTFTVAKSRLGKGSMARLGKLPRLQKFEEGGKVFDPDAPQQTEIPAETVGTPPIDPSLPGYVPPAVAEATAQMMAEQTRPGLASLAYSALEGAESGVLGPATGGMAPPLLKAYRDTVTSAAEQAATGIENAVGRALAKPEQPAEGVTAPPKEQPLDPQNLAALGSGAGIGPVYVKAPQFQAPALLKDTGSEVRRDAEMKAANAIAAGETEKAKLQEQYAKWLADNDAKFRARLEERRAEAEAMRKDIAAHKIDPNRYWSDASTGQKVVAAISVFLGGLGSRGGANQALNLINKFVDEDIAAQKIELGKKQNLLSVYMDETKDLRAAENMLRADKYNQVAAQIDAFGSRTNSAKAKAAAEMAKADFLRRADDLEQKNTQGRIDTANAQATADYQARLFNAQQAQQSALRQQAARGSLADRIVKTADGKEVVANRAQDVTDISNRTVVYDNFMRNARELQRMVAEDPRGTWVPGSEKRARAQVLVGEMRLQYQAMIKGTPSDKDQKLIDEMMPMEFIKPTVGSVVLGEAVQTKMDALVNKASSDYFNGVVNYYTKPLEYYFGPPKTAVQQQYQARANQIKR